MVCKAVSTLLSLLASAVGVSLCSFPLLATEIELTVDLAGSVVSDFDPELGQLGNQFNVAPTGFTANLNEIESVAFTARPPDGKRIAVSLPTNQPEFAGTVFVSVRFYLRGPLNEFNASNTSPLTLEFLGLTGSVLTELSSSATYRQNGNQVEIEALYSAGGPFSFQGLRVRMEGPFTTTSETFAYELLTHTANSRIRFFAPNASSIEQFVSLVDAAPMARPVVRVRGGRVRRISGSRVVIRGTAASQAGLARVEFKPGRAKFRRARGLASWRATVRLAPASRRVVVRFRAIDRQSQHSPMRRVAVVRRPR